MVKSNGKPTPSAKKMARAKKRKTAAKEGQKEGDPDNNSTGSGEEIRKITDWPGAKTEMIDVDFLHPDPKNPNKHSNRQIELLGRYMDKWGWTTPVLARESGMLIAGEGRWLAAKKKGYEKIPTMFAIGWSEEDILAFIIADNEIAKQSTIDKDILAADITELSDADFDIELLGVSDEDLAAMKPREERYNTDPDDVPAIAVETVCQRGDIWILGNHKLICGDSTSGDVLERLMVKEKADAVWTDPPEELDDDGEDMMDENYAAFLVDGLVGAFQFMKKGAAIYVAHAEVQGLDTRAAFKSAGFKYSECIIWDKATIARKRRDYQPSHAPILYGWKTGAKHRWYGDRRQRSVLELDGSTFAVMADGTVTVRAGDERIVIAGQSLVAEAVEPTVITVERQKTNKLHPQIKPVELVEKTLRNSAKKGDIVLDLFGGSGTTLVAAELNGWRSRLVELDEVYCDVIVRRWQELVGRDAVRQHDEAKFADLVSGTEAE